MQLSKQVNAAGVETKVLHALSGQTRFVLPIHSRLVGKDAPVRSIFMTI